MRFIVRPKVLFLFVSVRVLNGIEDELSTNSHQLYVNASKLNFYLDQHQWCNLLSFGSFNVYRGHFPARQ